MLQERVQRQLPGSCALAAVQRAVQRAQEPTGEGSGHAFVAAECCWRPRSVGQPAQRLPWGACVMRNRAPHFMRPCSFRKAWTLGRIASSAAGGEPHGGKLAAGTVQCTGGMAARTAEPATPSWTPEVGRRVGGASPSRLTRVDAELVPGGADLGVVAGVEVVQLVHPVAAREISVGGKRGTRCNTLPRQGRGGAAGRRQRRASQARRGEAWLGCGGVQVLADADRAALTCG